METRRIASELSRRGDYDAWPAAQPPHVMPGAPAGPLGGFGGPEEPQNNASLWSMLDDRMRGRWRWAIPLAIILGAGLAIAGYFSTVPKFRSTGAISVAQQVPAVLHLTDFHTQIDPERFRASQAQLVTSPRVLERALNDEEIAPLEFVRQPRALRHLKENLDIERDRESQLIRVSFEADDPVTAQTVTNAVLRAYYEIYGQYSGQDVPGTLAELKDNEARFMRELSLLQSDRRAIDLAYPTGDLITLHRANMELLIQLDAQVRTAKRLLNRMERNQTEAAESPGEFAPDPQMLEQVNPMLTRRRLEWSEAQIAFDNIKDRRHGGNLYNSLKEQAERSKKLYEEEYRRTVDEWRSAGARQVLPSGDVALLNAQDIAQLEAEYAELVEQQKQLAIDLTKRENIVAQEEIVERELENIRDRVRKLEIEGKNLGAFISIAHYGSREEEPHENARRKRAIMGAALGFMASFGGFFLLGTIDRRAFGASQLMSKPGSRTPPCLGVLPDLGRSLSDPESSDIASHCVHQIRNQIEAVREPHSGYVLAVSSPFQGDGKTSIVMALGWSYAAAGYRTLVIDCDLVGRSLTRQLGLVGREGLRDAMLVGELNGSISRLPVDGLCAVPAGIDAAFGAENLRRRDLEMLLRQVRDRFDMIIIDTGPMFGSLECTPVTAVADGVLLSVRRGRSRSRLEECTARLEMMRARCIGVVLNCAWRSDCDRYVSEMSLAAAEEERAGGHNRHDGASPVVHTPPGERNALVRAVQQSTRVHAGAR